MSLGGATVIAEVGVVTWGCDTFGESHRGGRSLPCCLRRGSKAGPGVVDQSQHCVHNAAAHAPLCTSPHVWSYAVPGCRPARTVSILHTCASFTPLPWVDEVCRFSHIPLPCKSDTI